MSNLIELTIPAPESKAGELDELIVLAESSDISGARSLQQSSDLFNMITEFRNAAERQRTHMKQPALEAGRRVDAYWKPIIERAEYGRKLLSERMSAYMEGEKRKHLALEAKAREDARKEQERIQLEAAELETRGREDAARLRAQAEAQARAGNSTVAADLKESASRAEMGAQQDAQLLLEHAQQVMPLSLPEPVKVSGISPRRQWDWEGIDLDATISACCPVCNPERRVTKTVLTWNREVIGPMVRAQKEEFDVPGVIAKPELSVAATGKP